MTCCMMSEKLLPLKKRSLCVAKNRQAKAKANQGPSVAADGSFEDKFEPMDAI